MRYISQKHSLPAILAILLSMSFGCQSGPVRPTPGNPQENPTPIPIRDDIEADLLALLFTGDIVASQESYLTISTELQKLRHSIPDSLEFLKSIHHSPSFSFNRIKLGMDSIGRVLIRAGEYSAWDDINSDFGLVFVDTFVLPQWRDFNETMSVTLGSPYRFNPFLVSERYNALEGIDWVGPIGMIGDSPSLYFGIFENEKFFLIREAWGDCPSGCISSRYYLFVNNNDGYSLEHYWPSDDMEGFPQWLTDAKRGILINYDKSNLRGVPWELRSIPGPP